MAKKPRVVPRLPRLPGPPRRPVRPLPTRSQVAAGRAMASQFQGVSYYKRINRFEVNIWLRNPEEDPDLKLLSDSSDSENETDGQQKYLGSCDSAEAGGMIYDRAYIKFVDGTAPNFGRGFYEDEIHHWIDLDDTEFIFMLRNMSRAGPRLPNVTKSTRTADIREQSLIRFHPDILKLPKYQDPSWKLSDSIFRGVYKVKNSDDWVSVYHIEKNTYRLGVTDDEVEAARLHDIAEIKFKGKRDAQLNFELKDYDLASLKKWKHLSGREFAKKLRGIVQRRRKSRQENEQIPPKAVEEEASAAPAVKMRQEELDEVANSMVNLLPFSRQEEFDAASAMIKLRI